MTKALVSQVPIGNLSIEGLMDAHGDFYVSVSQVSELFQLPKNHATRDAKALLGKGFQLPKLSSELNPKQVNVLTLEQFSLVMLELAFKGNEVAQNMSLDLAGLSLTQLFSDSFGKRFEADDRQAYLVARASSKVTRRTLTDAIKDYIELNGVTGNRAKFMYANVSDALNRGLFGHTAKSLCEHFKCPKNELRNHWDTHQLRMLERVEDFAMELIDDDNLDPMSAINKSLDIRNRGKPKLPYLAI